MASAESQQVGPCLRECHPGAAVARQEDIAVRVVVEDPPHMAGQEMLEREVPLVDDTPDPLAGVVQIAGPPLGRSAAGVDLERRRRRHDPNGIMMRRRPPAAPQQEQRSGDRGKVSSHRAEYGLPTRLQAIR
jgi:hypothetical protein